MLTRETSCTWYSYACPLLGSLLDVCCDSTAYIQQTAEEWTGSLLDVCCDSTERGVISGEAREQCISPLYRSPLLKLFPKSAAVYHRIFSDILLSVFFFLMGSMEDAQKLKSFFLSSNSSE